MNDTKEKIVAFCKECVWAWAVYDHYTSLFEKGEERLKLMETVASTFFSDLLTIYKGYLFSQICKLTDPAKTMGKFNLTTNYIIEYLPWPDDVREKLVSINNELNKFRDYIIPARHKILSHTDLNTTIDGSTLGSFPKGEEMAFWKNLQEFMNTANGAVFPIESTSDGDADEFIEALKKAVDYDEIYEDMRKVLLNRRSKMKFKDA